MTSPSSTRRPRHAAPFSSASPASPIASPSISPFPTPPPFPSEALFPSSATATTAPPHRFRRYRHRPSFPLTGALAAACLLLATTTAPAPAAAYRATVVIGEVTQRDTSRLTYHIHLPRVGEAAPDVSAPTPVAPGGARPLQVVTALGQTLNCVLPDVRAAEADPSAPGAAAGAGAEATQRAAATGSTGASEGESSSSTAGPTGGATSAASDAPTDPSSSSSSPEDAAADADNALLGEMERLLAADCADKCYARQDGWWTYEFCFGRHVVQKHVIPASREPEKGEAAQQFVLGRFNASATLVDAAHRRAAAAALRRDGVYTQLFTDGTTCDTTNQPRRVVVKFVCSDDAVQLGGSTASASASRAKGAAGAKGAQFVMRPDFLKTVREVESCVYEVEFMNSAVCHHPAYRAKVARTERDIHCAVADNTPFAGLHDPDYEPAVLAL